MMFGHELAERLVYRVVATGHSRTCNGICWYYLRIVVCIKSQRAAGTDVTPIRMFANFNEANAFVQYFGHSGVWQ